MGEPVEVLGDVTVTLLDARWNVETIWRRTNLVTDAGDLYLAQKAVAAVAPASASAPSPVNGMKLGTGTAATTKNGSGAALGVYVAGSAVAFDATYPQASSVGAGAGAQIVYKSTFGPGVGTASAVTEAVIVDDAGTNATSTAEHTISRVVFPAVNKAADKTLVVVWTHRLLGQ